MHPKDDEKTTFMIDKASYYYKVMSFDLKNVGATNKRMMNFVFEKQIGRNLKVYIHNMIVKSRQEDEHLAHLQEVFMKLRKYNMLNPTKCIFGV